MKQIRRFEIEILRDSFELLLPAHAKFLSVQLQEGRPQMWFLVDLDYTREWARKFFCFGTGLTVVPDSAEYLGTIQMPGGILVWHFFEDRS